MDSNLDSPQSILNRMKVMISTIEWCVINDDARQAIAHIDTVIEMLSELRSVIGTASPRTGE